MHVENMVSPKGNKVPNQFLIDANDTVYFQSYNTVICAFYRPSKTLYLNEQYWDYSKTTLKYLKIFINENTSFYYETLRDFRKLIISEPKIEFRMLIR